MRKNRLLAKLRSGKPAFGIWLCVGSPILAEEAARVGFDWVLVDTQHGYWGHDAMINTFQVVGQTETELVARAAWNDTARIGQLLDAGALSLIVPMVNSRDEARQVVAAMRFPPKGIRSAGGSRTLLHSPNYFNEANEEIMVTVMIETVEAAERADEILSVPGVDCCLIGSGDLALSMGMLGSETEAHEKVIRKVLETGRRHGVAMGFPAGTVEEALKRADQGFQLLTCGSDIGAFWEVMRRSVADLKAKGRM